MPANQKTAVTLLRFAKSRDHAFRTAKIQSLAKMKAIREIKTVASNYLNDPDEKQLEAVRRLEPHLLEILPHPDSRFTTQRQTILTLISQCHA